MNFDSVFERHKKVALQFSGGKDSLACLFVLQKYWDRLTVYYCNSGDAFPETLALMDKVKRMVPHFVEIQGRTKQVHAVLGIPSDVVPCESTVIGRIATNNKYPALIDRYTCCYKSLIEPTHARMKADNITVIIRGQKNADKHRGPCRSGEVMDGFEMLYPIENWSDTDVFQFLSGIGFDLPQYYKDGMNCAPDCMSCTAWLGHGIQDYVKRRHPEKYEEVQKRLNTIAIAIEPLHRELVQLTGTK